MKDKKNDLLQGTLDLLVLKSLALGPLHGLGVSNRIAQITQGTFQVNPVPSSPPCIGSKKPAGSNRAGANPKITAAQNTTALPKPDNASSKSKPIRGNASPWPSPMRSQQVRKESTCHYCHACRVSGAICSTKKTSSASWLKNCAPTRSTYGTKNQRRFDAGSSASRRTRRTRRRRTCEGRRTRGPARTSARRLSARRALRAAQSA